MLVEVDIIIPPGVRGLFNETHLQSVGQKASLHLYRVRTQSNRKKSGNSSFSIKLQVNIKYGQLRMIERCIDVLRSKNRRNHFREEIEIFLFKQPIRYTLFSSSKKSLRFAGIMSVDRYPKPR